MDPKEKIILALDVDHFEEARKLVLEFREHVGMFKVGKQLFTHCGPKIVDFIKLKNSKVFLDLKYHDIPNTVAKASIEALRLGVDMLNVHASGGFTMMKEASAALHSEAKAAGVPRPKIIGVTVLTSLDDAELARIGFELSAHDLTRRLALLAKEAGLDGVVASGEDIEMIRAACEGPFVIVTPGVRVDEKKDDQRRTITPKEAIARGATYIVLGRTVTAAKSPLELLDGIIKDISNAPALDRPGILKALSERPSTVRRLLIEKGYERFSDEVIKEAKRQGISFRAVPADVFSKQVRGEKAHICLETDEFSYTDQDLFLKGLVVLDNPLICAFDGIFDPQNLGNIVRSASCFEVGALIMPKDGSCGVTETVARISKGGLAFAHIVRVTNLARYLDEIKGAGIFCYGLDEGGTTPIWEADLKGPVCLVFGKESGLRRLTKTKCDEILTIPTSQSFRSLNLATSFAAAVYEARRQRAYAIT